MTNPYRMLPSVDRLLAEPALRSIDGLGQATLLALTREALDDARSAIARGEPGPNAERIVARIARAASVLVSPSLRPVINATGVIIHTNLGRSPLSEQARMAMDEAARGYTNLEYDLESGERGSRYSHLTTLLIRVTGAEAGIAINNNAGALVLALSTLAAGKEVIISRSQAVEIGGGFRIPDVMRQSGARLIEVGTTNRTYTRDFEDAIGPETAAIMRVHSSNFRLTGFTSFPALDELARIAHERGILLLDDLGSGCLLPVEPFGLPHEPMVQESVSAGADVSMFSGDKLLGGPQAGLIVGRTRLIQQMRAHPLARALRMDKSSVAGLAATLFHYLRDEAVDAIPVWRMIATSQRTLARRAGKVARAVGDSARIQPGRSVIGGGSLPDETLPSVLVALPAREAATLAGRLRMGNPPVVCRIEHDNLLFDLRTVDPAQDNALVRAIIAAVPA